MTISPAHEGWVPDACTLPTVAQPIRVAEFDRFFTDAVRRSHRPTPTRLELLLDAGAENTARDLAARETSCCSFFTFGIEPTDTGPVMSIEVPATYTAVLDALAARVDTVTGGHQR
ncbi:hypothetical protein GV791_12365 [Nocardia cyriacigeorgica]|uniref:Arsenate reductase n=1 Tax=Nocardia cyriacigeorgica TaxID=135487 RepID=A0A6P1CLK9_9NOCA|nr:MULTISPECIES: hypothetical protein [Nocardia]MBF6499424.1 hypothetical protein [Nocardia cyriacigeorgica]NEW33348.1 hypothetical protein [Nocardia cyriacigeorgica]